MVVVSTSESKAEAQARFERDDRAAGEAGLLNTRIELEAVDSIQFVIRVTPEGDFEILTTQGSLSLEYLQQEVGGYIERFQVGDIHFIFNEEGRIKNLPKNVRFPTLCGRILICGETAGNFIGLPKDRVEEIMDCMDRAKIG